MSMKRRGPAALGASSIASFLVAVAGGILYVFVGPLGEEGFGPRHIAYFAALAIVALLAGWVADRVVTRRAR